MASEKVTQLLLDLSGGNRSASDEGVVLREERASELVMIDESLTRLEKLDARQAKVVELRFFGGLSVEETAEATGISTPTVKREWAMAKAWLYRELSSG